MASFAVRFLRGSAAAALALGLLSACGDKPAGTSAPPPSSAFKGIDITGADYAKTLELTDAEGKARTLADFKGKVTVVFFGFTQCPDVCPTTMAELAEVKKRLGPDGERIAGIFVTVDPDRDTPELLKAYVGSFDPSFVGLRGNAEQTAATAKHFKVFYAKVPGRTEGSYTIDHTAGSYLFDAQGRVRVFTRHGSGPDALQHDLKQLLAMR
ncbi:MAG: SCO family protein [Rubrivivax sp.]|nr:SCO family protein [Rubrivivax sp.]